MIGCSRGCRKKEESRRLVSNDLDPFFPEDLSSYLVMGILQSAISSISPVEPISSSTSLTLSCSVIL